MFGISIRPHDEKLVKIITDAARTSYGMMHETCITPRYQAWLDRRKTKRTPEEIAHLLGLAFMGELPKPVVDPEPLTWQREETIYHKHPVTNIPREVQETFGIGEGCIAHETFPEAIVALEELRARIPEVRREREAEVLLLEQERQAQAVRAVKLERERWITDHLPSGLHHCEFDNLTAKTDSQAKAIEAVMGWMGSPSFVMLAGQTRTGKTHLAAAVFKRAARNGLEPLFIDETELMATWRSLHASQGTGGHTPDTYLDIWANHPYIVLDDFGTTRITEANFDAMWRVINHRHSHKLPTVITTNYKPSDLMKTYGEKMVGRISLGVNRWIEAPPHIDAIAA